MEVRICLSGRSPLAHNRRFLLCLAAADVMSLWKGRFCEVMLIGACLLEFLILIRQYLLTAHFHVRSARILLTWVCDPA